MKKNPDPFVFAQGLIHELAHIRATVDMLSHFMICDLADKKGVTQKELLALFKSEVDSKSRKFYEHYSKGVGVSPESE